MLLQEEGQQHEEASVMNDPPHIHRPILQTLLVAGETVNVLGHQQGLVGCCRLSHGFLW